MARTDMLKLYEQREEIVSTLAGSTTARAADVAVFVDQMLAAQASRVANGGASARKRSERLRGAIRQACGALPLHWPGTPGAIMDRLMEDPQRYGLKDRDDVPCEDVVRDEVKRMRAEQIAPITLAASLPLAGPALYALTHVTT